LGHSGESRNPDISIPPLAGLDPGTRPGPDPRFAGVTPQETLYEIIKFAPRNSHFAMERPCPPSLCPKQANGEANFRPCPARRQGRRAKTMRRIQLPGSGGQAVLPPGTWPKLCRGARRGALEARLILRNNGDSSTGVFHSRLCFLRAPPSPPGHKFALAYGKNRQSEGEQDVKTPC
jgi:hypothetical protein